MSDDYAIFLEYGREHGWAIVEAALPEGEWMFGMPTWRMTVTTPDGLVFADGTRFGTSHFRYGELLEAMREWDGLAPDERARRVAEEAARDEAKDDDKRAAHVGAARSALPPSAFDGVRTVRHSFRSFAVGDAVNRMIGGAPMKLRVTALDERLIHCGPWTFDRDTGIEVDDDLGWGPEYEVAGTWLVHPDEAGDAR